MIGYIILFFVFGALCSLKIKNKQKIVLISLWVSLFTGIRYNIGFDYMQYWTNIEKGWYSVEIFSGLLQELGHETNPIIYFLLSSFVIYPIMINSFCKDSFNIMESVLFFLCFQSFYIVSLSIVRQATMWAIIWWLIYQKEKSKIKILICSILAFCFHSSGLIGLLLLFPWNKLNLRSMYLLFFISVFGSYALVFFFNHLQSDGFLFIRFATYMEEEMGGATKIKYIISLRERRIL